MDLHFPMLLDLVTRKHCVNGFIFQERLQGNSVLANARSWGVKIVHVDGILFTIKHILILVTHTFLG